MKKFRRERFLKEKAILVFAFILSGPVAMVLHS